MLINNYLQSIQEYSNLYIKQNSYDLEQFENGKINKLFIMGAPGSGKTTLAHKLQKKYRCDVLHTDDCVNKTLKKIKQNIRPLDFWKKCYKDCVELSIKSNKKLIIEGIIFQWYYLIPQSRSLIIQYPSIILNKLFKQRNKNTKITKFDVGISLEKMLNFYINDKRK